MASKSTQWDETLPFKRFNSMIKVFSALPTLPLHEWTCRYMFLVCLKHAVDTKKPELFASAVLSSALASAVSKVLAKREALKFPAQATVMINPRQSMHEYELLACAVYVASLAARRHGGVVRGALGEAALAGLLTHLFCAPADANGPRFLWWTWHEDHPNVKSRLLNNPISQAMFEMSTGVGFSLVAGWVLNCFKRSAARDEDSLASVLKEVIHWLPEHNRPFTQYVTEALDSLRDKLFTAPSLLRVAAIAVSVPAIQALITGMFQIAALDHVGSPSLRSYKIMIALLTFWASSASMNNMPVTISDSRAGAQLAATVVAYFAVQAIIPFVGEPTKHVSTGAHQTFGRAGVRKRDAFGNKYEQNLTESDVGLPFTIEGSTRAALLQELEDKREALDDLAGFLKAAEKRVGDTELALQETIAWSKQTRRQVPHLTDAEFLREMDATNSVRVARIRAHLETKLEKVKLEKSRIMGFETKLRAKIAKLEDLLEIGSVDPAGNSIIPASPVGPASVWYTIRGVVGDKEEAVSVLLVCLLGMTAFTKALAYGT